MIEFVQGEASEAHDPRPSGMGGEEHSGDHSFAVTGGRTDLSSDLARVGSIPASREVIDGALRLVVALTLSRGPTA